MPSLTISGHQISPVQVLLPKPVLPVGVAGSRCELRAEPEASRAIKFNLLAHPLSGCTGSHLAGGGGRTP
jgi:hypothetical protein